MKKCSKCKKEKELTCFYKHHRTKDGYRTICIECEMGKMPSYRVLRNPISKICKTCTIDKPINEFVKQGKWHSSYCKKCCNKKRTDWRKSCPEKEKIRQRRKRLYSKYKIDIETFEKMLLDQDGKCKICTIKMEKPCIDHCHSTKQIRGILCSSCNTGLGMFKDNEDFMNSAIQYIKESKLKQSDIL